MPSIAETSDLEELCYSALPLMKDGKTWYTTAYENPFPEKAIVSFNYTPIHQETAEVLSVDYTGAPKAMPS